jgi:hypothetical protein
MRGCKQLAEGFLLVFIRLNYFPLFGYLLSEKSSGYRKQPFYTMDRRYNIPYDTAQ